MFEDSSGTQSILIHNFTCAGEENVCWGVGKLLTLWRTYTSARPEGTKRPMASAL